MKQNIRLSVRLRMADADDGWEDADGKMQIESADWKKIQKFRGVTRMSSNSVSDSAYWYCVFNQTKREK